MKIETFLNELDPDLFLLLKKYNTNEFRSQILAIQNLRLLKKIIENTVPSEPAAFKIE